ncbi:MAG: LytTR family DNA-binding domain-containing protein [Petrimonas sp.]|nr:LytTR family DNA-binding domain-containing protein [Petrimonas sp.]
MNKKIPRYLYERSNTVKMILFTALFALMFINIFQPFGSRSWYPDISDFKYFAFSSLIILTGMLVVVVSRLILIRYGKKHSVTYWEYGVWILGEILAMAVFYSLFSKFVPKEGAERDLMDIFRQSTTNTALVLLLPYAISWLYFSWKEKSALLAHIDQENKPDAPSKPLIAFPDEKGELRISIMLENLLYIESADNYANICYLNKAKQSHFLLRNSLKWIEENLTNDTPLVRCHRSYIVSMEKVKILKKTKNGIMLELDAEGTPDIPVSKTYYQSFMNKFSQYSVN